MTASGYDAPALPEFERYGLLWIRSLAECGTCEARSPWWYGDMPATWPTEHAGETHPHDEANTRFRIWRVLRFGAFLTPDRRLTRVPLTAPGPEPAAFALSQCRTCGDTSHWLTADREADTLAHYELTHQHAAHRKAPAQFDRWHLTRAAADPHPHTANHEHGTRT